MIPEGYEMQTTFFEDYAIANVFGEKAVKDTYKRSFRDWKNNVTYMKEMTFVLNIMCWEFYHKGNMKMSELYSNLYHECYDKCLDNFKGDELQEYWSFLD